MPQRVRLARAHAGFGLVFTLSTVESSQTPAATTVCSKQRGLLKTARSSFDGEMHIVVLGFFRLSKTDSLS